MQKLTASGATAVAVEADVQDEASCRALIARSVERLGRLDILVNNAGTAYRKPPQDYTLADWQRVIDVNLTGAFVCAHAAYPHMVRAGGGKIINIGSMLSIFATSYAVAYAASKGGIVQMTKALACAWAKDNIQANAILPGWIDTEFTRTARHEVPGLHERVLARTPAGRWGSPDDLWVSRSSLRAQRRVSSPGPRFRSTAAFRRRAESRMSRKSGNRFSEKDMRQSTNLKRIPIQLDRDRPQ